MKGTHKTKKGRSWLSMARWRSSPRKSRVRLCVGVSLVGCLAWSSWRHHHTTNDISLTRTLKTDAWFAAFGSAQEGKRAWLQGCKYVYLDVGSNRGIQIRKMFEPQLYPDAPILPLMRRVLGPGWSTRLQEVCAIGFEPNPANTAALEELQAAYRGQGWRVHIFTGTAAAITDGEADLTLDQEAPEEFHQPGSSLVPVESYDGFAKERVKTIDLARYINEEVLGGGEEDRPVVVMKLDLEGYEHTMMPHLLATNALCKLHTVFYEEHGWGFLQDAQGNNASFFTDFAKEHDPKLCPVKLLDKDDETYDTSTLPLPMVAKGR